MPTPTAEMTSRPPSPALPAAPSTLRVECRRTLGELEELRSAWDALFDRVPGAPPFLRFDWVAAWWAHLHRRTAFVCDDLRVFSVRDGDTLIAVAPMMHTVRAVLGVPLVRSVQPIGTDPNITEVRGILVRPEHELRAVTALAAQMESIDPYDQLVWRGLVHGGPAMAALLALPAARESVDASSFVVALPDTWDALRQTLSRNTREALRKCYRSLERDGHTFALRVAAQADDVRAALPEFFRLHRARSQVRDGVRRRDCFAAPAAQRFLTDFSSRLAERGAMRVFQLEIGGKVVATRLGFVGEEELYLYYSGYDAAWAKYSVMTTTLAETLKYAISERFRFANLSTGADRGKLRWGPQERRYGSVVLQKGGLRAAVARRIFTYATALREARQLARRNG